MAESNGCAAGPTIEAATLSALLEVVERDAFALWWFSGREPRKLNRDLFDETGFRAFASGIRDHKSQRFYRLLDISTDLEIPVVAAVSAETDGAAATVGFGAGPDLLKAAKSAFLEMCQMELAQELALLKLSQDGEQALNMNDRMWVQRHKQLHLKRFRQFSASHAATRDISLIGADPLGEAVERLNRQGFAAYYIDHTQSLVEVPVVRALVPGLQSPKPDWLSRRCVDEAHQNGKSIYGWQNAIAPI